MEKQKAEHDRMLKLAEEKKQVRLTVITRTSTVLHRPMESWAPHDLDLTLHRAFLL